MSGPQQNLVRSERQENPWYCGRYRTGKQPRDYKIWCKQWKIEQLT